MPCFQKVLGLGVSFVCPRVCYDVWLSSPLVPLAGSQLHKCYRAEHWFSCSVEILSISYSGRPVWVQNGHMRACITQQAVEFPAAAAASFT